MTLLIHPSTLARLNVAELVGGLHPFLAFAAEIRNITYTTHQNESINYQRRKITKTRGSYPSGEAAIKLVYLGIRDIDTNRDGKRGSGAQGMSQALNAFAVPQPTSTLTAGQRV